MLLHNIPLQLVIFKCLKVDFTVAINAIFHNGSNSKRFDVLRFKLNLICLQCALCIGFDSNLWVIKMKLKPKSPIKLTQLKEELECLNIDDTVEKIYQNYIIKFIYHVLQFETKRAQRIEISRIFFQSFWYQLRLVQPSDFDQSI